MAGVSYVRQRTEGRRRLAADVVLSPVGNTQMTTSVLFYALPLPVLQEQGTTAGL